MLTASFILFMIGFLVVGLMSFRHSQHTSQDYYVASRSISPWLVGLSAVATNNSGYMFIGVIGYTYATGLASIWLMIGWISGDFLASLFVHKRLHRAAERTGAVSYADVLASWDGQQRPAARVSIAALTILFLITYAAAQFLAGSKALNVLLGWPQYAGGLMGCVLVILYCFAGGIRASIWTDAAQSVVMIIAMGVLLWVATAQLGGPSAAITAMQQVDGFMDWVPNDLAFPGIAGGIAFAVSWLFAGLSVIGQPHIMVRFMTLNDSSKFTQTRAWYYLWFSLFYAAATAVGMLSRIYLSEPGQFDAELALPTMAASLLPEVLVGLILAGIFAATMSTADSLVLACSSALTHDLLPKKMEQPWQIKTGTLLIAVLALLLALQFNSSVFTLVILSWSTLASAFAPLLILWIIGQRPNQRLALSTMALGVVICLSWRSLGWHNAVYEGAPAIIAALLCYPLLKRWLSNTEQLASSNA